MKEKKTRLSKKNLEQVKDTAEKVMEAIPDELLDQVTGAGNPFDDIPRVPTQPIDEELRNDT